jgi:hypothetical protein
LLPKIECGFGATCRAHCDECTLKQLEIGRELQLNAEHCVASAVSRGDNNTELCTECGAAFDNFTVFHDTLNADCLRNADISDMFRGVVSARHKHKCANPVPSKAASYAVLGVIYVSFALFYFGAYLLGSSKKGAKGGGEHGGGGKAQSSTGEATVALLGEVAVPMADTAADTSSTLRSRPNSL